jgi:C4-dicarboxylate-specific signal transduction histidine kinase
MNLLDISLQSRVIIGISAMVLLFSSFLIAFITNQRKKLQYHRNIQAINEQQQRALLQENVKLEDRVRDRTLELSKQKENLQNALTNLKASQLQLVQKEKMASLGEVASGIAHEIQNPLNFINNFAEINSELLNEMKELIAKTNLPEIEKEEIKALSDDVIQNMARINQHGRRADSIVKNLQQHARTNSSDAELTDINFLADEYLKLSYHGVRAREPLFNANIKTSFDSAIERINIVPQDIGRVLMNIYNNAFYSVNEKHKKNINNYEPTVTIVTKKEDGKVKIIIRDNGVGISQKYMGKIFQPFFTTKPTGVGTGLGLSLSYDIIKANQGEITVDSIEGEFAEFTIELLID